MYYTKDRTRDNNVKNSIYLHLLCWLWKPKLKSQSLWCMIMSLFCFLRCSYISYNGMPVFNFAEHCSEQTKPLSSGQTIDYDDPTQALILENTIHHTTEAEDFVRIKRGHPLNASVWLSDSETDIFLLSSPQSVYFQNAIPLHRLSSGQWSSPS